MDIANKSTVTSVTVTLTEREAKLLCLLVGSMPTGVAGDYIRKGVRYKNWIGSLDEMETIKFVQGLYDGLDRLF